MSFSNYLGDRVGVYSLDIQGYSQYLSEFKRYKIGKSSDLSKENFRRAFLKNNVLVALDCYYKDIRRRATIDVVSGPVDSIHEGGPIEFELVVPEVVEVCDCAEALVVDLPVVKVVEENVFFEPPSPLVFIVPNIIVSDVFFTFSNTLDGFCDLCRGSVIPFAKTFDGKDCSLGFLGFFLLQPVVFYYYRFYDSYGLIVMLLNKGGIHKNPGPPMDDGCPSFISCANDSRLDIRTINYDGQLVDFSSKTMDGFTTMTETFNMSNSNLKSVCHQRLWFRGCPPIPQSGSNCGTSYFFDNDVSHMRGILPKQIAIINFLRANYYRYRFRVIKVLFKMNVVGLDFPVIRYGFVDRVIDFPTCEGTSYVFDTTVNGDSITFKSEVGCLTGDPMKRGLSYQSGDCSDGRMVPKDYLFWFLDVQSPHGSNYGYYLDLVFDVEIDFFERVDSQRILINDFGWGIGPFRRCCPGNYYLPYKLALQIASVEFEVSDEDGLCHFLSNSCYHDDKVIYERAFRTRVKVAGYRLLNDVKWVNVSVVQLLLFTFNQWVVCDGFSVLLEDKKCDPLVAGAALVQYIKDKGLVEVNVNQIRFRPDLDVSSILFEGIAVNQITVDIHIDQADFGFLKTVGFFG